MGKKILVISFALVISFLLVFFCPTSKAKEPQEVYRVYLKGKSLGLIENKEKLEQYIDKEQEKIKNKYKVDKVYAPEDLKIEKEITYQEKISTTKQIYDKLADLESFTINGYAIKIKGIDTVNEQGEKVKGVDQTIYVLDKDVFTNAMDKTIRSFVNNDDYEKYLNNKQKEIKDTGTIIENVYIDNKISVKNTKVPVDKTIYENVDDLSKYLLFGTLDEYQKYTVQDGDTITDIAFNNKLSDKEFLIANPSFKDENSLLFTGQQVTINIIKPQFRLVEVDHTVFDQEIKYDTEVKYDENKMAGTEEVTQKGENGLQRVTSKIQKVNGQIESSVINESATERLKEPVKEIIVKGKKQNSYSSGMDITGTTKVEGYWKWPTATPYTINSPYGYRWGVLHDGVDIGGGYGSPIYAANNGVVVQSSYKYDNGQFVVINHNNGYYTMYAHLSARYVKVGQNVSIGQQIGAMGKSGFATGTHLHFGLFRGFPYRRGSTSLQPLSLF